MSPTDLPIDISDSEDIVRGIKTPHHVKKNGELRPAAFRPPKGNNCVSVIRLLMGEEFCRNKTKEICDSGYIGRAILNVGAIRKKSNEVNVVDAREGEFLGHAHILYLCMSLNSDNPDTVALPLFRYMVELARFEKD